MALFPYNELKYYFFGLRTGLVSFFANGFSLGIKKSLGKIAQPINAYTRFPEYYYFDTAIEDYLHALPEGRTVRILDVGSPKMMGLYLGACTKAEVTLTDISALNVDEYRLIWRALASRAKGKASFSLRDGRSLGYGDGEFDVVFSMSVIEHIEGESGDSKAMQEMIRVLKPGGLLVLSVPFGSRYVEQQRVGFSGAVRKTEDSEMYFFQRIYDPGAFEKRILSRSGLLESVALITVWRRNLWIMRTLGALGAYMRGFLGFMNPLISALVNRSRSGMDASFKVKYGDIHAASDIYGDLIMIGRKAKSS